MITILADFRSPRLTYVAETIFRRWMNLDYKIVTGPDEVEPNSFCIAYGKKSIKKGIRIFNEGLLEESHLRRELPEVSRRPEYPTIFEERDSIGYDFSFDLFSAVFFCLSRYEEYVIPERDQHGRFQAKDSIFYGYNRLPYLDQWILKLESIIRQKLTGWENPRLLLWCSTLDMDVAFAYRGRSVFRILGGAVKDLLKGRTDRFKERISVILGKAKDPFDTYRLFLDEEESDSKMLFVPMGARSKFDKNLDVAVKSIREHIFSLSQQVQLGLHPSYQSLGKTEKIEKEKTKLEQITGFDIDSSRQHFLRLSLPETMISLQSLGIKRDFSIGFHDEVGFRSGTAYSHSFYDLKNERELTLEVIPLIAMDSAMKSYMKISAEEAIEIMTAVVKGMQHTGGTFTTVWHNHSLSETEDWIGWRSVYMSIPDMIHSHR